MNGTEIRQLNAEDAAEYQAVFLGALQSAPTAGYGEESARSSDQIAERFRREVIFGAFEDGRLCAITTFLQQTSPERRHVGAHGSATDNLAAIHPKLTQDELKSLDEASQLPPEYPEWMLATQGADRLGAVDLSSKSVNKNKQQFNSVDERLRQDVRH
jgi:hypothetical protein